MGEVVNLRTARKQRDRETAAAQAEENRARFGRSKSDKLAQTKTAKRDADHLDNHRRET